MDKKSTVNDLYQVAVIRVFAIGYSMLGKKILKVAPPSIQKFDLEDKGKLVAIITASLIRGALANALAFTGSFYLFLRLSKDSTYAKRKRHDAAIEQLQKAQIEWVHKRQEQIDFINKQLRLETKEETKFTELNDAMRYLVTSFHPCLENWY